MPLERTRSLTFLGAVAAGYLIRRRPFLALFVGVAVTWLTALFLLGLPIPLYHYVPGATAHNLRHPRSAPGKWRTRLVSQFSSKNLLPRNWCPLSLGWNWDYMNRGPESRFDFDFLAGPAQPSSEAPDERLKASSPELPDDVVASLADQHANDVSVFVSEMGFGVDRELNRLRPPCVTLPLPSCEVSAPSEAVLRTSAEQIASDGGSETAGALVFATPRPAAEREGMRHAPILNYLGPHESWNRWAVWNGEQVQLVSLLMHPTPRVYETPKRPRWMHEGADSIRVEGSRETPTRELTPFESEALDRLRAGEEVAIQAAPGEIRMLGAVRARADCRNCHVVPVGTLLGAFSYRLLPVAVRDESRFTAADAR